MRRIYAAIQFLTVVPAPDGGPPARAAALFPLVGASLGLAAGVIRFYAPLPSSVAALLALAFLVAVTGALHEDGLADVADAFRAGRTPERILAILKDSRIGVYGAVALILTLLLRWQAIEHAGIRAIPALLAAGGTSRGAMVVLASVSRPLGEGLGKAFCLGLGRISVILAGLQSAAVPFAGGLVIGAAALAANVLAIGAARAYFHRRAGGVTGDCLGAMCQISETLTLLIFLCRFS
jgi:adenosylcobinamide-GDP ribazoletransferase